MSRKVSIELSMGKGLEQYEKDVHCYYKKLKKKSVFCELGHCCAGRVVLVIKSTDINELVDILPRRLARFSVFIKKS